MNNQIRWRSPTALRATLAFMYFMYKNITGMEVPWFVEAVELLLAALVLYGVFNNPLDKNNY